MRSKTVPRRAATRQGLHHKLPWAARALSAASALLMLTPLCDLGNITQPPCALGALLRSRKNNPQNPFNPLKSTEKSRVPPDCSPSLPLAQPLLIVLVWSATESPLLLHQECIKRDHNSKCHVLLRRAAGRHSKPEVIITQTKHSIFKTSGTSVYFLPLFQIHRRNEVDWHSLSHSTQPSALESTQQD